MPLWELRVYLESIGDSLGEQTTEGYRTTNGLRYVAATNGLTFDGQCWRYKIIYVRV